MLYSSVIYVHLPFTRTTMMCRTEKLVMIWPSSERRLFSLPLSLNFTHLVSNSVHSGTSSICSRTKGSSAKCVQCKRDLWLGISHKVWLLLRKVKFIVWTLQYWCELGTVYNYFQIWSKPWIEHKRTQDTYKESNGFVVFSRDWTISFDIFIISIVYKSVFSISLTSPKLHDANLIIHHHYIDLEHSQSNRFTVSSYPSVSVKPQFTLFYHLGLLLPHFIFSFLGFPIFLLLCNCLCMVIHFNQSR